MATKVWVGTDSGNEGDWGTAANWSPSGVPVSTDDVYIYNTSQSITGTLNQSAVALNSLTIDASFTGLIGSSQSDFLQVGTGRLIIGQKRGNIGTFTGSKRLNIDLGTTTACQVEIYSSASSAQDQNRTPIRLEADNASTDLRIYGGSVSISDDSDDATTIGDIEVQGGTVSIGAGVTMTDLTMSGGTVNSQSAIAGTAKIKGGTFNSYDANTGAVTIATATISDSGVFNHYASGTITTLNCNGGLTDLTKTQKAKTVTTTNLADGAGLVTDTATVTHTTFALASTTLMTISTR